MDTTDDESSDDDSDDAKAAVEDETEQDELEIEEEKPPEGDPTSTFAAVNMDWDHITSTDLFATFSSFVPKDGKIFQVSIYPSEFGKQRMQQEDLEGPSRDLFKAEKKKQKDSDDESDDDDLDMETAAKKLYEEDDGVDYNSKALRKYQLQRLRYYYAIVKCDSVETSKAIYDNCDGTEYESTANIFDLRYVPEDMEFDDEPRDECSKVPANYKPSEKLKIWISRPIWPLIPMTAKMKKN
ncbi:unnamed protein product [Ambrosiozyma monospora]|uniref:Unnamed protein product n=1 Tax=Ambrosiozyma monospora TaxID=43982 RepID=A0ACB5UCQ5_AMBMO|nr:unnamed protein product [Ambrosiozyma monospora]